jgi:hypothetical protein
MLPTHSLFWSQVVLPSLALFGVAGSVLGISVGLGLLFRSAATLRFFDTMNRWISTRRALKPLEIPRYVGSPTARKPRWNGLVLLVAGAYVAIILGQLDGAKMVAALAYGARYAMPTEILLKTIRWIMVAGGLAAMAVGAMLLFFPSAYPAFEARANHWYSTRQAFTGGDSPHLTLDRWVAAYPRFAGAVIAFLSVIATLGFVALLLSRR